jgi:hypothetical protein
MGSWLSIALCDCPETGALLAACHYIICAGLSLPAGSQTLLSRPSHGSNKQAFLGICSFADRYWTWPLPSARDAAACCNMHNLPFIDCLHCMVPAVLAGLPRGTQAAVASVLLQLPLLRHVWAWMGCVPADYGTMRELLQSTSIGLMPEVLLLSYSCTAAAFLMAERVSSLFAASLTPERTSCQLGQVLPTLAHAQGVAGIFLGARKGQERIYARAHRGYIRLAMEAGAGGHCMHACCQEHTTGQHACKQAIAMSVPCSA